jgi:rfaE bifunctional protein kinase chain/domain
MKIPLTRTRLLEILAAVRDLRIGVVGDFTLDGYWYADMERAQLSRETPLYPRPIYKETYSLGGSANVAWSMAALGVGEVWAFSVLGADWRGEILRGLLTQEGIRTSELLNQSDRTTPFYGKVMLTAPGRHAQEDARLDFINTRPLSEEIEDAFMKRLEERVAGLDALVVADYQSQGVVTARITTGLCRLAQEHPELPVVVDSRERDDAFQELILKPNDLEAARLFFPGREAGSVSLEELRQAAEKHNRLHGQPIVITLGDRGCLVCDGGGCEILPGVRVAPPVDPVGAGDTFLAVLSAGLASQASPVEAACLANLAAAVTVQQIGVTGTASPAQVTALYDQWAAQ